MVLTWARRSSLPSWQYLILYIVEIYFLHSAGPVHLDHGQLLPHLLLEHLLPAKANILPEHVLVPTFNTGKSIGPAMVMVLRTDNC